MFEVYISVSCLQIKLRDVDFWSACGVDPDQLELLHRAKMYPPRIEMTVQLKQVSSHKLSIIIIGCDDDLELQFLLPLQGTQIL